MPELSDADKTLLEETLRKFDFAADHRKQHEPKWERLGQQYVLYNDFKASYTGASEPDRDAVLRDGQREWGVDLRTPWAFATVETLVPRQVAHRPRMLILPRRKLATPGVNIDDNAANMRFLVDGQQEQIDYELKLQTAIKGGQINGIAVMKSGWRFEECTRKYLQRKREAADEWEDASGTYVKFDDPDVDALDIWDFYWDPYAASARAMEWAFHRSFRSTRYVLEKLELSWKHIELGPDDLKGVGGAQQWTEARTPRMRAEGLSAGGWQPRDEDIHEILEFHDGKQVVTVLDRRWIVQQGDNPYWHGELPFYVYRPSERPGQFVGTGVIEPIEQLVAEMDMMRSDRRDAANLRLNLPFIYDRSLVDEDDIVFAPGVGIGVNGPPDDVIKQIRLDDIPGSGYQETAELKADIERATGLSEPIMGGQQPSTATGAQLAVQNASERVKLMTLRAMKELVAPCTRHFGMMNQQKIRSNREIAIPAPPEPDQPERRWAWKKLGPAELMGEFAYIPEGDSMAPDNVPQMRQDFQYGQQLANHPAIDQRKWVIRQLKMLGVEQPEEMLAADDKVSVRVLDVLKQRLVGGPDDDDSPIVIRDPDRPEEPPREMHPQEVDEFIEGVLLEVEELERQEQAQQELGQQQGQVPSEAPGTMQPA